MGVRDLHPRERGPGCLHLFLPSQACLCLLVLTQHACRLFTGPCLPVSGLFVSSNAHTCPHLLMPAHTCPLLCMCTPARARPLISALTCPRLHLPMPAHTTPALTCSSPYLPMPAHTCPHLSMPISAPTCLCLLTPHLPSPVHEHAFQSSTPLLCHSGSLPVFQPYWVWFLLFERLLPHLSPGFLPVILVPPLGMTLLCARERNLS